MGGQFKERGPRTLQLPTQLRTLQRLGKREKADVRGEKEGAKQKWERAGLVFGLVFEMEQAEGSDQRPEKGSEGPASGRGRGKE